MKGVKVEIATAMASAFDETDGQFNKENFGKVVKELCLQPATNGAKLNYLKLGSSLLSPRTN